jgi:hypothetical protein
LVEAGFEGLEVLHAAAAVDTGRSAGRPWGAGSFAPSLLRQVSKQTNQPTKKKKV